MNQINAQVKCGALFNIIQTKKSGEKTETGFFHNLVLDTGLERMSVGDYILRCCIGRGNSTPKNSQTALDSFAYSTATRKSTSSGYNVTGAPYFWYKFTWSFGLGVVTGNISEVGLGWANNNLWNRALIKDNLGNPTTITVLSDEYLDIASEIRFYPQPAISGSFNLYNKQNNVISEHTYSGIPLFTASGGSNDFASQKVCFGQLTQSGSSVYLIYEGDAGGSMTSRPAGTSYNATVNTSSYPTATSAAGNISCNPSDANSAGHKSFAIKIGMDLLTYQSWGYKWQINPPIPKNSAQSLRYDFLVSWGRYTP